MKMILDTGDWNSGFIKEMGKTFKLFVVAESKD